MSAPSNSPPALIGRKPKVPIGRRVQRVPAHQHGARLLGLVEPQQKVRKADDRARALFPVPQDGLRQRVIGAVRERVAVDHQQRPAVRRTLRSAPPCAPSAPWSLAVIWWPRAAYRSRHRAARATPARGRSHRPCRAPPGRRRRPSGEPRHPRSAACGRGAAPHFGPSVCACNPNTCTSALPDGACGLHRPSPARAGADTPRGSRAPAGHRRPRTSSGRCRARSARRCNPLPARPARRRRRARPRARRGGRARRACSRISGPAAGCRSAHRARRSITPLTAASM